MLRVRVEVTCPPNLHQFNFRIGSNGPFVSLCACERAICTGTVREGHAEYRIEVLGE